MKNASHLRVACVAVFLTTLVVAGADAGENPIMVDGLIASFVERDESARFVTVRPGSGKNSSYLSYQLYSDGKFKEAIELSRFSDLGVLAVPSRVRGVIETSLGDMVVVAENDGIEVLPVNREQAAMSLATKLQGTLEAVSFGTRQTGSVYPYVVAGKAVTYPKRSDDLSLREQWSGRLEFQHYPSRFGLAGVDADFNWYMTTDSAYLQGPDGAWMEISLPSEGVVQQAIAIGQRLVVAQIANHERKLVLWVVGMNQKWIRLLSVPIGHHIALLDSGVMIDVGPEEIRCGLLDSGLSQSLGMHERVIFSTIAGSNRFAISGGVVVGGRLVSASLVYSASQCK